MKISKKAFFYNMSIAFIGFILALYFIKTIEIQQFNFIDIFIFLLIEIFAEKLSINMPKWGNVSVGFGIDVAAFLIFDFKIAALLAGVSFLLDLGKFNRNEISFSIMKRLFNAGQIIITISIAGIIYDFFSLFMKNTYFNIVNVFIFTIAYLIINVFLVCSAVSLTLNLPFKFIFIDNFKGFLPNYALLAILGYLMAQVYNSIGIPGIILFFIPLLIARYVFKLYSDLRESYLSTIRALVAALEAKDPYTKGHSERVSELAVEIAREMGMKPDELENIRFMALLHDVGKIGILDTVLNKKGTLDPEEKELIQEHPVLGAKIVEEIPFLKQYAGMVRHHHERFDGTGYPDKVSGEKIPLGARIIAVADTYDAMTSDRPYRAALTKEQAMSELERNAGQQHDPRVVNALLKVLERFDPREKEREAMAQAAAAEGT
ncbi:HD-GYP domain-containing protein [Carboxydothermus ferrireducens]|uniref:Nucleotidyltransferase with HDIG domain n=1 Tax=Carboxydothermus ferrireducens DSM 11255 TaxID=1119529 RepID=A0ABX2R8B9_9THEO|nr:HD-GYP domain-containing protein [Carboxydothermus ferrireducens]NYE57426.1 putative nucleotidyltransferase with HDIG domain [Carboxydothermus ferrireducens DSM 11255]